MPEEEQSTGLMENATNRMEGFTLHTCHKPTQYTQSARIQHYIYTGSKNNSEHCIPQQAKETLVQWKCTTVLKLTVP